MLWAILAPVTSTQFWRVSHLSCLKLFFRPIFKDSISVSSAHTTHHTHLPVHARLALHRRDLRSCVHHHLGHCLPHERRGLWSTTRRSIPTTRSPPTIIPNYACSARVLVPVCLCSRACAVVLLCSRACACVFSGVLVRPVPSVPSVPSPLTVPPVPSMAHALRGWWAGMARTYPLLARPPVRPSVRVLVLCSSCACAVLVRIMCRRALVLVWRSLCARAVLVPCLCCCVLVLCVRGCVVPRVLALVCVFGPVCLWHAGVGCIGGLI